MLLSELAKYGLKLEVVRDGEFSNLGSLSQHKLKLLVNFYNVEYEAELLSNTSASCAITYPHFIDKIPANLGVIVCDNPLETFYQIHHTLIEHTNFYGDKFPSQISPSAQIHPCAYISPDNVIIGDNTIIGPNVSIFDNSLIGNNVIIRAGTVIGGEGFEFKLIGEKMVTVQHAGGVKIHDNVEIQSNTVICKSVFKSFTEIGEYTKIDNLVHVAHDVVIGHKCRIVACTMIGGSANIGNNVWLGPNSTISSEITIQDGAYITLGAVVTRDVKAGGKVSGNFAIDHKKLIEFIKTIR